MASLTFYRSYNMITPLDPDGSAFNPLGQSTINEVIVAGSGYAAILNSAAGTSFTLAQNQWGDWGVTAGTAVSVTFLDLFWGKTIYKLTGAAVNMNNNVYDIGYDANGDGDKEFFGMRAEQAYWLSGADTVIGSSGDDTLGGFKGNDSVSGGQGNDVLLGGLGNDIVDGGAGVDILSHDDLPDSFGTFTLKLTSGNLGTGTLNIYYGSNATAAQTDTVRNMEILRGSYKAETIDLSSSAGYQDGIQAMMGSDTVKGGDAAVLVGSADTITDGDFVDYRAYAGSMFSVSVDLRTSNDKSALSALSGNAVVKMAIPTSSTTTLYTFDQDWVVGVHGVIGTGGNDSVTGSIGNDWFRGGVGNDTFVGGAGNDFMDYRSNPTAVNITLQASTVTANQSVNHGSGIDQFVSVESLGGTDNNDVLTGNDDKNILRGNGGNDTLNGGLSTETNVDIADYRLAIGAVTVAWSTSANIATSGGADGVDSLTNMEGARGSDFNDTFTSGGKFGLWFDGRGGVDTVSFTNVGAGVKIDLTSTLAQNQIVPIGANIAAKYTVQGIENLTGSGYADNFTGSTAANVLLGGAGNDTLSGGLGKDVLTGGLGNDLFDFNALTESGITSTTWDVITDFASGDKIDLLTLDANTVTTATNEAFTTVIASTAAFTTAGQLKLSGGILYGNTDADSTAEFAIQVAGMPTTLATATLATYIIA